MKVFKIGRKKVGVLDKGVFSKDVTKSIHLFRVFNAWGIDAAILNSLPNHTKISIHDIEEDKTYLSTKELFLANGIYKHFKEGTKDHYTQVFLPLHRFVVEKPKELTQDEKDYLEYKKTMGLV